MAAAACSRLVVDDELRSLLPWIADRMTGLDRELLVTVAREAGGYTIYVLQGSSVGSATGSYPGVIVLHTHPMGSSRNPSLTDRWTARLAGSPYEYLMSRDPRVSKWRLIRFYPRFGGRSVPVAFSKFSLGDALWTKIDTASPAGPGQQRHAAAGRGAGTRVVSRPGRAAAASQRNPRPASQPRPAGQVRPSSRIQRPAGRNQPAGGGTARAYRMRLRPGTRVVSANGQSWTIVRPRTAVVRGSAKPAPPMLTTSLPETSTARVAVSLPAGTVVRTGSGAIITLTRPATVTAPVPAEAPTATPTAAPRQLGQAPAQPGHVPATTSAQPGQAPANAPPAGDGQHIITVHAPTAAGPEIITSVAGPVLTVPRPVTGTPTTAGELPGQTPSEASATTITGELDQLIKGNPATVDELALLTRVPADVSEFDTVPAVAAKIAANASANPSELTPPVRTYSNPPESPLDAALRSMPARPATAQADPASLISPEQTARPGSSYTIEQLDQTIARYNNVINRMKQAQQINQLNDLINRTPSTQPDPAPIQQQADLTGTQNLAGVNDAADQASQNAATGGASSSSQTIEGEVTALPGGPGGPNDINIDATGPSDALPEPGIPEASGGGGGFATVLNIAMLALQGKSMLDTVQQQGLQGLNPIPKWQTYSTLQNWVSSWPTSSAPSAALSSAARGNYNPADPANAADLAGVVNIASNSTQGLSDPVLPWSTGDPGVIDNVGSNGEPKYLVAQQLLNSDAAIAAVNNPCLGPASGCSQAQRVAAAQDWQNQVGQATTQVLANAINNYGIDSVQQPTIWQQLGATGASLGLPIPDGATDQAVVAVNSLWNSQPQSTQGQAASVAWQQANPNNTLPVQTVFVQQPSAWDTFSQGASQWLAKASSAGTTAATAAVVTGQIAVNSAWNGAPQQQSPQNIDSPAAVSTGGAPAGTVTSGCHGGCMAMMYVPTQIQGQGSSPGGATSASANSGTLTQAAVAAVQQGLQVAQQAVQQAAQPVVQQATQQVQQFAQNAGSTAQNVASTVQQQAQQAAQSTAVAVTSDAATVAATAASDAATAAATATTDVQNAAVTAAADAANVAAAASSDQQAVTSTATSTAANVAATAATDAASVAATASSDQQAVTSTVSSDAANVASAVSSDAQLVAQGQAAQAAQAAQQQAQQAAAAVQQQAADTATAAQQQVQQAAQAAADQATQAAAAVQQQAQQAAQAVADQAAAATQAAQQQAAQVAQAAGAAAQAVGTAVQQGVQAVGSALGIAPSS